MPKSASRRRARAWRPVVAVLAALAVLAAASGCSAFDDRGPGSRLSADGKPVVLTTFTVLQDIAQNVAGDHLQVESLTKFGAEIHGYEPTPSDLVRASGAVLILDNGLNLELWFSRFVQDLKVPHVVVSEGVTPVSITEDAYEGKDNPHAWMSPVNAQIYVTNMVRAFSDLDPARAADYAANGARYTAELQQLTDDLRTELGALPPSQRALVSCEGAFSYLARDVGLTESYIWPVNADTQGTPQQIAGVIEFVRSNRVPAVFCESTVSDRPMLQVVDSTGARFGGTLYVDSLSAPDGPVPTYLDLLRHDAGTILDGLTSGSTA